MLVVSAAVLAACASPPPPAASDATPASPPVSARSQATAVPDVNARDSHVRPRRADRRGGLPSPLSGIAGGRGKPLLAVKVDNTSSARPHTGVKSADVVYVQQVEGNLSRLLAIFGSKIPPVVAPVRSARVSDIDLLATFPGIAFAYSGAQSKLLPMLEDAPVTDVSPGRVASGWFYENWRPVRWNAHAIDPQTLLDAAPGTYRATTGPAVFDRAVPAGGRPVTAVAYDYGASLVEFRWDSRRAAWVVWFDGVESTTTEGGPLTTATVLVQYVKQDDSQFTDRYGGVTPQIESVGSGSALVLRDGRVWPVRWSRPEPEDHTVVSFGDGTVFPFAPGPQWVVLAADRAATTQRR